MLKIFKLTKLKLLEGCDSLVEPGYTEQGTLIVLTGDLRKHPLTVNKIQPGDRILITKGDSGMDNSSYLITSSVSRLIELNKKSNSLVFETQTSRYKLEEVKNDK